MIARAFRVSYAEPVRQAAIGAAAAALLALVPAAAATTRAQLTLMPLAKSDLGADAIALPLDPGSGVQTNADAAHNATGKVTAAQLARLGRLTGYALDYNDAAGRALAAGRGLLEVKTGVDRYRSAAAARAGVAFWRRDEANLKLLRAAGVAVSERFYTPSGVPGPSFAMSGTATLHGKPPIYGVDIVFARGDLVAEVSVSAADAADRRPYAEQLAVKLASRIGAVLAGRVSGPPVPLPAKAKAGPPPNGPDLTKLVLTADDLGQVSLVKKQGYTLDRDLTPVSAYTRLFAPAGLFLSLQEEVALFHSSTEASFSFAGFSAGLTNPTLLASYGGGLTFTNLQKIPVHAGDEAVAVMATAHLATGQTVLEAIAVVRTGATMEVVAMADLPTMTMRASDVQALVATAGKRAAAGLHG